MGDENPAYFAIIPAHVRYCKELEPCARLLYGEITALSNKHGYCWASNEYFADLYGVDTSTIFRWLDSLKKLKFIYIETKKIGIKWDRKIFVSLEVKEMFTKMQKCDDRDCKNAMIETAKMRPYKDIVKNKEKEKQQHAPAREPIEEKKIAAAAFSKELIELGISNEDAVAIGKEFTEKEIVAAVSFVKKKISSGKCSNPGGMLVTFLREKWQPPCNEAAPPPLPTEDTQAKRQEQAAVTAKANKQFYEELATTHKLKDGHTIQIILGDLVISKPNGLSETLNYEFEWFQQSLKKYYELK